MNYSMWVWLVLVGIALGCDQHRGCREPSNIVQPLPRRPHTNYFVEYSVMVAGVRLGLRQRSGADCVFEGTVRWPVQGGTHTTVARFHLRFDTPSAVHTVDPSNRCARVVDGHSAEEVRFLAHNQVLVEYDGTRTQPNQRIHTTLQSQVTARCHKNSVQGYWGGNNCDVCEPHPDMWFRWNEGTCLKKETVTLTPTPTRTGTSTPTPSPTPSKTHSITTTGSRSASHTPSATPTPSATTTPTYTSSPTISLTSIVTQTATLSWTGTATTHSPSRSSTTTETATLTTSPTQSGTRTATQTDTRTFSPSRTWTPTLTRSTTTTRSYTLTQSHSRQTTTTATFTPTKTGSDTKTASPTKTYTRTATPTGTLSFTLELVSEFSETIRSADTLVQALGLMHILIAATLALLTAFVLLTAVPEATLTLNAHPGATPIPRGVRRRCALLCALVILSESFLILDIFAACRGQPWRRGAAIAALTRFAPLGLAFFHRYRSEFLAYFSPGLSLVWMLSALRTDTDRLRLASLSPSIGLWWFVCCMGHVPHVIEVWGMDTEVFWVRLVAVKIFCVILSVLVLFFTSQSFLKRSHRLMEVREDWDWRHVCIAGLVGSLRERIPDEFTDVELVLVQTFPGSIVYVMYLKQAHTATRSEKPEERVLDELLMSLLHHMRPRGTSEGDVVRRYRRRQGCFGSKADKADWVDPVPCIAGPLPPSHTSQGGGGTQEAIEMQICEPIDKEGGPTAPPQSPPRGQLIVGGSPYNGRAPQSACVSPPRSLEWDYRGLSIPQSPERSPPPAWGTFYRGREVDLQQPALGVPLTMSSSVQPRSASPLAAAMLNLMPSGVFQDARFSPQRGNAEPNPLWSPQRVQPGTPEPSRMSPPPEAKLSTP